MKYSYYPGCSLEATAGEYDRSARAALAAFDCELEELEGWNCCGASSGHSFDHALSVALPARVLALAEESGRDLVVPCAACYNRLCVARHEVLHDPDAKADIEAVVGRPVNGSVKVWSPVTLLDQALTAKGPDWAPPQPLKGLKVAAYYGCLLVRPPEATGFDHPEQPQSLQRILSRLGAEPVKWSYAIDCCGGSLSLTRPDAVRGMVTKIVGAARESGADALVTACPLCQMNLEMRQTVKPDMPCFYFSELAGVALNLPGAMGWLKKHLIDPTPLLRSLALTAA